MTKYHCVGAVLEQREEQCTSVWIGSVCRGSSGAAALVSASAQFCSLGLEFEAFVDGAAPGANWQILFYFSFVFFKYILKLWLWPQLVERSDLQFKAVYCCRRRKHLQVKWKYAAAAEIKRTCHWYYGKLWQNTYLLNNNIFLTKPFFTRKMNY